MIKSLSISSCIQFIIFSNNTKFIFIFPTYSTYIYKLIKWHITNNMIITIIMDNSDFTTVSADMSGTASGHSLKRSIMKAITLTFTQRERTNDVYIDVWKTFLCNFRMDMPLHFTFLELQAISHKVSAVSKDIRGRMSCTWIQKCRIKCL